jgi:DNA-binding NarL/FixJ family response regulator
VTIRVLLADDQALVRSGFRMILDAEADVEVVGEARDGDNVATLVTVLRPDVVLMDVHMPEVDGIEATRRIVASGSEARVIVLTTYDADEYVFAALRAGASGFLLKGRAAGGAPGGDPRGGTRRRSARPVSDPALARAADRRPTRVRAAVRRSRRADRARTRGVPAGSARAVERGDRGARLVASEATVKTHVSSVLRKLRLRDRVQAVILAYDLRLVRPRSL